MNLPLLIFSAFFFLSERNQYFTLMRRFWQMLRCGSPIEVTDATDLARQRELDLTTARAEQLPKYSQIRTESRLFLAPPRRHLTFPSYC